MRIPIKAYAATAPRASLEPFSYDPGELEPEEVEIKVTHCGICLPTCQCLITNGDSPNTHSFPVTKRSAQSSRSANQPRGSRSASASGLAGRPTVVCTVTNVSPVIIISVRESQGTIVGRHGGFADRLRVQWLWARPLPESLDIAKAGPLLCGGVTVFSPLLQHNLAPTARVGVIGIGGLGHMALLFANKWGYEVHAFTTSDGKEEEARKLGAHQVHNTKRDGVLKEIAGSLDLIISTINVPLDIPGLLATLAPKGVVHVVGAVLEPMQVPAFSLIAGRKSVTGSPVGSPSAIDQMLAFSTRHSIAPITETFPMSKVNDALEHLRAGKARYRIVLVNQ
jgi:alcohol/geraniol dehydrogenase (NADP+)